MYTHRHTRVYTYSQGVSDQVCRLDQGLPCSAAWWPQDLALFLDSVAQSNGEEALASWVLGEGWRGQRSTGAREGRRDLAEGRRGARQNRVTPASRSRWGAGGPRAPPASLQVGRP